MSTPYAQAPPPQSIPMHPLQQGEGGRGLAPKNSQQDLVQAKRERKVKIYSAYRAWA